MLWKSFLKHSTKRLSSSRSSQAYRKEQQPMAKARPIIGLDAYAPTGKNARIIAHTRLEDLYTWESYVDSPLHIRELHNLRIATKRLRYTLEIFEEVLPEACKPIIKELELIQEELGMFHDCDVMITLLRLCLGSQEGTFSEVEQAGKEEVELQPQLVARLTNQIVAPSTEERYGLEQLLLR